MEGKLKISETNQKFEEIKHFDPIFMCIWELLLQFCSHEMSMFDAGVLKRGVP